MLQLAMASHKPGTSLHADQQNGLSQVTMSPPHQRMSCTCPGNTPFRFTDIHRSLTLASVEAPAAPSAGPCAAKGLLGLVSANCCPATVPPGSAPAADINPKPATAAAACIAGPVVLAKVGAPADARRPVELGPLGSAARHSGWHVDEQMRRGLSVGARDRHQQ